MKVLLDENMPESVRRALAGEGHEVDSIASLRLKGLDNGRLYREIAVRYEICFSKDREFVRRAAEGGTGPVKMILVAIPQQPAAEFTEQFLEAFAATRWNEVESGAEWHSRLDLA